MYFKISPSPLMEQTYRASDWYRVDSHTPLQNKSEYVHLPRWELGLSLYIVIIIFHATTCLTVQIKKKFDPHVTNILDVERDFTSKRSLY